MDAWILIVAFAAAQSAYPDYSSSGVKRSYHIAMQEFGDLQSCQLASVEAQKIAPGIRVVCVQKAVQK